MFGYSFDEERSIHESIAYAMLFCSVPTFISLLVFDSPFGKHAPQRNDRSKRWLGPLLPARPSWFVFEVPNILWAVFSWYQRNTQMVTRANGILLSLFAIHYVNRAIIYPLRMKESKPMPFLVVLCAVTFCSFNG